jgi:GntR family transcriptional regulator
VGTPLLTIERVRTADGRPVVYSLDTLAEAQMRGPAFDANRLLTESVYGILQGESGRAIDYGVARLLPAVVPDLVAEHLGLARGAMVLYLVQTDYTSADEPLLYSREYHLPDAFDFIIWRRGPARLRPGPAPAE